MVSEFDLGQTQTTPRDPFSGHRKHTQNRPLSTEQTNPEKCHRYTQQIMNLATQLAVKELL